MKRDINHIDSILQLIRVVWIANSDQRFSQLISNVQRMEDPFYLEDEEFVLLLKRVMKDGFTKVVKKGE